MGLIVTEMGSNEKFKDLDVTAVEFTSMVDLYILRLTPSFSPRQLNLPRSSVQTSSLSGCNASAYSRSVW